MSELSSRITLVPHLLQKYVPLPGFSPVVGIKPPFIRIVKDMTSIYQNNVNLQALRQATI